MTAERSPRVVAAAIGAALALTITPASSAFAISEFRTPKHAAYCGPTHGAAPPRMICWTPDDGFTVSMDKRGRARSRYVSDNRGFRDPITKRVLRFGKTWRNSVLGYRCVSRRTGLTCRNRDGHGWWLGRFRGYRLF